MLQVPMSYKSIKLWQLTRQAATSRSASVHVCVLVYDLDVSYLVSQDSMTVERETLSQQTLSMNFNLARWAAAVSWKISRPVFNMKQLHSHCRQQGKLRDQIRTDMTTPHVAWTSRWSCDIKSADLIPISLKISISNTYNACMCPLFFLIRHWNYIYI